MLESFESPENLENNLSFFFNIPSPHIQSDLPFIPDTIGKQTSCVILENKNMKSLKGLVFHFEDSVQLFSSPVTVDVCQ